MQDPLIQMEAWYSKTPAQLLLKAEKQQLDGVLARLFGYYLLQLGGPACFDLLAASPIRCRVRVSPEVKTNFPGLHVSSQLEDLPFANNSIDVVLLPHALEFAHSPQRVLQEVKRILIPEGYAIILSFNPFSLWGLSKIIGSRHLPPWHGQFHSMQSLRQWLDKSELSILDCRSLFFRPPLANDHVQKKLLFWEGLGQLCWPSCGAVTMIMVKKKLHALTPIRLRAFAKQIEVEGRVVKPTAREKY